jgi:hypothetical protein
LVDRDLGWRRWIAPLISAAILIAAFNQLRGLDFAGVLDLVPRNPLFWGLFTIAYVAMPASEWLIFRRLWGLPIAGFAALMRKRISNDILLGYSGDLYFYGWARRNAAIAAAPFGAVKDVAILSAAVGNAATLVLLFIAWPLLSALHLGLTGGALTLSVATIAASSLATLGLRRAIFSLPGGALRFILLVTVGRVVATMLLTALLWSAVLPGAPIAWWLLLATLRMLVSRLPFVPNKDVVFAGLVAFLIGRSAETSALLAMLAALTLATHLLLGAALSLAELLGAEKQRCV